jgi:hypothetical protein
MPLKQRFRRLTNGWAWNAGVGFRQLRTCRRTHPGQLLGLPPHLDYTSPEWHTPGTPVLFTRSVTRQGRCRVRFPKPDLPALHSIAAPVTSPHAALQTRELAHRYHESKRGDFSTYIFVTSLKAPGPGWVPPCPIPPGASAD